MFVKRDDLPLCMAGRTVAAGPRQGERVTVNPLVTWGHWDSCVSGRSNVSPTGQIVDGRTFTAGFGDGSLLPKPLVWAD
jgi:threonine dehydrogenase-like Zn-dependent dehydrogenase